MSRTFLGLGSNLGDRRAALAEAIRRLEEGGIHVRRRSSIWETEPVGGPLQGWFLNMVVAGETGLGPQELLRMCLDTEEAMGRVRAERDGPRLIDVDVLFFDDLRQVGPGLEIPHPRLHERRFVLEPLCEIAPTLRHPVLGLTVAQLRERCPDDSAVKRWAPAEVTA